MTIHTDAAKVDHLVVIAATLAQGVAWCEATLGIAPGPGGEHAVMGTHNRLFKIAGSAFPRAYFEIIAIHAGAPRTRVNAKRWYDMDDEALQARVARDGPQLVHWVAGVSDARAALGALATLHIDRGEALQASRMTPAGLLQWQITVREDGQRLFNGCLPTLIQWGEVHPADGMPDSGVTLQSLRITHPRAGELRAVFAAIGIANVPVNEGPPDLAASFATPRGPLTLHSKGL